MPNQDLITVLANAKCPDCDDGSVMAWCDDKGVNIGEHRVVHRDCNGSGLHSLTKLLRVECSNTIGAAWPHSHGQPEHNKHCWGSSKERCETHRTDCPGYRPATSEEAEAVGLKLLEMADLGVWREDNVWISCPNDLIENADGHAPTPLEAILNALTQVVSVEVPA